MGHDNGHGHSSGCCSRDEHPEEAVKDICAEFPPETTLEIDLTHSRITELPNLSGFVFLRELHLRQNLLKTVPSGLPDTLEVLELYDNLITVLEFDKVLPNLRHLDVSFNKLRSLSVGGGESDHGILDHLPSLEELYSSGNKIKDIPNMRSDRLRILELGDNRIERIDNLGGLGNLQQLWLGKNKIADMGVLAEFDNLQSLLILSLQANRIREMCGMQNLVRLKELYLSENQIDEIHCPTALRSLRLLDVGYNQIKTIPDLTMVALEEFWANNNLIASFEPLNNLPQTIVTVYLAKNPIAQGAQYIIKIRLALPKVTTIDYVRVNPR